MLNRHLGLRDLICTIAALVLLLGAAGCAQKEEMVTAEQEAASRAGKHSFYNRIQGRSHAV